ncbi:hypothetical protein CR513_45412, partial [Mucuna pruriens]
MGIPRPYIQAAPSKEANEANIFFIRLPTLSRGNILIGISSPISTSSSPASTFFGFFTSTGAPSTFSLADNSC